MALRPLAAVILALQRLLPKARVRAYQIIRIGLRMPQGAAKVFRQARILELFRLDSASVPVQR